MPGQPGPLRLLTPDAALALFGHGLTVDDADPLTGTTVVVVVIEDGEVMRSLARISRDCSCVTVGVAPDGRDILELPEGVSRGFDVLLSTADHPPPPWVGCSDLQVSLERLIDSVNAAPLAALSLVQLLRANATMTIADALVAESWVYSMLQSGSEFRRWLSRNRVGRPRAAPTEPPVVLDRRGSRLDIALNRPEVHNALSTGMREALIDALRIVVADPSITEARLYGLGPSFCSGGDLTEFGTAPDPVSAHVARIDRSVGSWLARCGDRVTAEIHGSCVGAGVELAAFARRVRAAPDIRIFLPEISMGLIPGAGGTVSIPRRIGRHRSAYLALTGSVISLETATEWGLVDATDPVDPSSSSTMDAP